jgi:hypothetical protein
MDARDAAPPSGCARDGRDDAAAAIPRRYNFAEDMIARNLAAGRAGKVAYIDPRGSWTCGELGERVAQFGKLLRGLGIAREQRILICLTDTIDWPTAFLGAVKAGVVAVHGPESRLTLILAEGFGAGSPGSSWRFFVVF